MSIRYMVNSPALASANAPVTHAKTKVATSRSSDRSPHHGGVTMPFDFIFSLFPEISLVGIKRSGDGLPNQAAGRRQGRRPPRFRWPKQYIACHGACKRSEYRSAP